MTLADLAKLEALLAALDAELLSRWPPAIESSIAVRRAAAVARRAAAEQ
jgi:hypothetical protein